MGTSQPPRYQAEGKDLDGAYRSYELDDDDDSLPFSWELKNARTEPFCAPEIQKYEGKRDPMKQLNNYKTQMSLRGASPTLKCRAFHLTLVGTVEIWYIVFQLAVSEASLTSRRSS